MHDDFYVIATGNPSRFRGRLELPMSLQTRFTTVLLHPIQPEELMPIIKFNAPDMDDGEARGWCDAFFEAKRITPTLTARALLDAVRVYSGCGGVRSDIPPATASSGKPIELTADLITINDRDVDAIVRALIADLTKYNAMLSEVLGSATPVDCASSSDFSPRVEDEFAALSLPSTAVADVRMSPAALSGAAPAAAAAAPPAAGSHTLKMRLSAQAPGKKADGKKDKEQPPRTSAETENS